jgi:hypothetical protein
MLRVRRFRSSGMEPIGNDDGRAQLSARVFTNIALGIALSSQPVRFADDANCARALS